MSHLHERVPEVRQEVLAESIRAGVSSPRLAVLRPVSPIRAATRGFLVDRRAFLRPVARTLLTAPLGLGSSWQSRPL